MNPIDYLAGLSLLEFAVGRAKATAREDAKAFQESVRGKSFDTDWGTVSLTRRKGKVVLDQAAFIEWVKANRPDEIITTEAVRASYETAFTNGLEVVDGDVYDPATGEKVGFAHVMADAEWLTVRLNPESKDHAAEYVAEHLESLLPKEIQ